MSIEINQSGVGSSMKDPLSDPMMYTASRQVPTALPARTQSSCIMNMSPNMCDKRKCHRRSVKTLFRVYVCPIEVCNHKYEAWRSLQHHLAVKHSMRKRKMDYPQFSHVNTNGATPHMPQFSQPFVFVPTNMRLGSNQQSYKDMSIYGNNFCSSMSNCDSPQAPHTCAQNSSSIASSSSGPEITECCSNNYSNTASPYQTMSPISQDNKPQYSFVQSSPMICKTEMDALTPPTESKVINNFQLMNLGNNGKISEAELNFRFLQQQSNHANNRIMPVQDMPAWESVNHLDDYLQFMDINLQSFDSQLNSGNIDFDIMASTLQMLTSQMKATEAN